ncbi:MAG TPA: rhomboid family intramembrane serine protease, partial [Tetrasphaera sp.]|nr:rhomboid family intramembrane serine protease [Tetrasphaera sp.]
MTQPYADPGTPMPLPVCPRHPDQVSYVRCQRCANPTCPQCQRPAAVGIQCVSCVAEAAKTHPTARTVLGGRRAGDARPVVTTSLIGVCAALYVLQTASGSGWLFQKFS